jgi:hypothetical protein
MVLAPGKIRQENPEPGEDVDAEPEEDGAGGEGAETDKLGKVGEPPRLDGNF